MGQQLPVRFKNKTSAELTALAGTLGFDSAGHTFRNTDTGIFYTWNGVAFEKSPEFTDGAAHVSESGHAVGDYCDKISAGAAAAYIDLDASTRSVTIDNYHATQHVWVGLGTSSEAPEDIVGTTGSEVGEMVPAGKSKTIMLHSGRTRLAYIASGASTTFNASQNI